MTPTIARHCPQCKKYQQIPIEKSQTIVCPDCKSEWGKAPESLDKIFDQCPVCPCRQFYISKDFNHFVGCLVMLVGIVLVPWTYGISLPVFALIDWLIHKKVSTILNCYRCGLEFRGFPSPKHFKSFMHHIGLKYDKYR